MKTTPKDFFLHLGVIVTLYTLAISLINLAFRIIEAEFPDQVLPYGTAYYAPSISWPVAILIIIFPIFVLLSWLLNRDYKLVPEKRALGIRRWLVYITLFVAGLVIAGDLVVLLYTFLNGEIITVGFILKVLVVIVVAGAIFIYYISDLRDKVSSKINKIGAWVSGAVIIALIVSGFSILGSPLTQRQLRIDSQRVADLQNIQWQIVNFWQSKQKIPLKLDELNDSISGFIVPIDAQTKRQYEYRIISDVKFELCAEFNLAEPYARVANETYPRAIGPIGIENETWKHGAGRTCFERTIDPQLYPPRTQKI